MTCGSETTISVIANASLFIEVDTNTQLPMHCFTAVVSPYHFSDWHNSSNIGIGAKMTALRFFLRVLVQFGIGEWFCQKHSTAVATTVVEQKTARRYYSENV